MPDLEQNQDSDFMREKIKERPVNKKRLLRRTLLTATMAVIFGLIACLTFLILEPLFNNWLYPPEEPIQVELPEEQDEIKPEDMLVADEPLETEPEEQEIALEEEQIQEILSGIEWSEQDYRALYNSLSGYAGEMTKAMVTITGAVSNTDWFSESYESEGAASGVLFFDNGKELLILVDHTVIDKAESLTATFFDGTEIEAVVKQYDTNTGLGVVAVQKSALTKEIQESLLIATLGTSNGRSIPGTPVVVLGSPAGVPGSICYGNITANTTTLYMADANYKLLQTDIFGSQSASGVIFDLQGNVLGIVTNGKTASDMKNLIAGYGISELRKLVEKMANGKASAYLGVVGTDVTDQANEQLGVPYGTYIREIYMDSPAMLAGVQRGDVIVEIDGEEIGNFASFMNQMLKCEEGSSVEIKVMRQVQEGYREMTFGITLTSAK